jgi:hypothetical protein
MERRENRMGEIWRTISKNSMGEIWKAISRGSSDEVTGVDRR